MTRAKAGAWALATATLAVGVLVCATSTEAQRDGLPHRVQCPARRSEGDSRRGEAASLAGCSRARIGTGGTLRAGRGASRGSATAGGSGWPA